MCFMWGADGATDDPAVERLREQQLKNFATLLMLSRGVPMFVAGDECRRTQRGNNNAYCQDNELNWFDWTLPEKNRDLVRFWQRMIDFRKRNANVHQARFYIGEINERGVQDVAWHGCQLNSPGWRDPNARVLSVTVGGFGGEDDLHVMMNMYWEPLEFELPPVAGRTWHRTCDTSLASPEDIADPGREVRIDGDKYVVNGRSVVVLVSK